MKTLLFLLLTVASQMSQSQTFSEGTHYSVIDAARSVSGQVKTNAPSVTEYFSFSCPGCYAIESSLGALQINQPTVSLERIHMPFGGPKAKFSQKVFVVMILLDAGTHKDAIFNRIHVKRNTFDSDDEIIGFFTELGYETKAVEEALGSFSADSMIRKMNKAAVTQRIESVPTVIVNGRYKVNVRALANSNSLSSLVTYLHSLDRPQ